MNYAGKVPISKNMLSRWGLQFLDLVIQTEQEACKMVEGLFKTVNKYVRPHHNETVLLLQILKCLDG